jgi:SAM-dependent methyltransferase
VISPHLEENNVTNILDVACGAGHLLQILEEHGYLCTGIDLSDDMLSLARNKVRSKLLQQDMRGLRLRERFDAVTCLGSSFTYMQTHRDVVRALRGFHRCIKDGGILIFDCFDAEGFKIERFNRWREETQLFDDMRITCRTMSTDWRAEDSSWDVHWVWVVEDASGVREFSDVSRLRAHRYDYLASVLSDIGFRGIKRLESKRLTILAHKSARPN